MAATKEDIKEWFERGKENGSTHLIVVCDTFDYEDYPVYVSDKQDVHKTEERYRNSPMQAVMEVYNLNKDLKPQIKQARCFEY